MDRQTALKSFEQRRRNRIGIPELFFDFNEIAPDPVSLFIAFEHRDVLSHIQRDDVVGRLKTAFFAFHNFMNGEILPLDKSFEAVFDPVCEFLPATEEFPHLPQPSATSR